MAPSNVRIELRKGKSPAQKLKDGEVDAIWLPRVPKEFMDREPWIRRLFPDTQGEVQRFRTGDDAVFAVGQVIPVALPRIVDLSARQTAAA